MDPKTQAEAQLLREQTEAADRNNWLLSTRQRGVLDVPAALAAAAALPSTTGAPAGALDTSGGAGGGGVAGGTVSGGVGGGAAPTGVAGTLANIAQPPDAPAPSTGFGTRDQTAAFAPYAGVVAGSYANDPSMANFGAGVNLGRDINLGPGADFPTSNAIVSSQSTPQHVASGDTLVIDPLKGNTPGNVIVGGDPAATAAEHDQRVNDVADANKRAGLAQTSAQQLTENQRLLNVYNTLVNTPGTDDTAAVIGDQVFKDLATIPGLGDITKLSSRLGAITAIQARLGSSINNQLQAVQPGDPVRGLLSTIKPPDPANLDPRFLPRGDGAISARLAVSEGRRPDCGGVSQFQQAQARRRRLSICDCGACRCGV